MLCVTPIYHGGRAVPISFLIFELPPFSSIQPSRRRM